MSDKKQMRVDPQTYRDTGHLQRVLAELHPALFSLDSPVPFKIGLSADVAATYRDTDPVALQSMFRWLTARSAYLAACKSGDSRIGLGGPSGVVTDAEAAFAAVRLQHKTAAEERRAANRARTAEPAQAV